MSTRALIVIDLQKDYFPGGRHTLEGIHEAADNAARAVAAARAEEVPVIHVRHEFPTKDAPFFAPGTTGAEIHEKVRPASGEEVILKHFPNSFRQTVLKEVLDRQGTRHVTLVGAMSHMCIEATARAAADAGYEVAVLHDGCATRDLLFGPDQVPARQVHAASMAALGFGYARLASTSDYVENPRGDP